MIRFLKRCSIILIIILANLSFTGCTFEPQPITSTTFVMNTIVTQTVYGDNAKTAVQKVDTAFAAFEKTLSLFSDESEVSRINSSNGEPVTVSKETFELVQRATELSLKSGNGFALSVAPLTLLWGITSDSPHLPTQQELDATLPLIDDSGIVFSENDYSITLNAGQGIDLGGIAKGAACDLARTIYKESSVQSAVLNIGGNVFIYGKHADGDRYNVGFRDPYSTEGTYIASVSLLDETMAVSGGYERFFEINGTKYHHILDVTTGFPAASDIVAVGVISPDGALADFMSTSLYVWGVDKSLEYMKTADESIIMLDNNNVLYVSKAISESFELTQEAEKIYTVNFI